MSNEIAVLDIRIAKIATCESLSGLSTLEYHVGYEAGNPDQIHYRIWKNSGGGKYCPDWVSLAAIEQVLSSVPPEQAFNSSALSSLLPGRSINTHSFIAACLLNEQLIRRSEKTPRSYERNPDTAVWWKEIRALIEAGIDLTPSPIDKPAAHRDASTGKAAKRSKVSATTVATP